MSAPGGTTKAFLHAPATVPVLPGPQAGAPTAAGAGAPQPSAAELFAPRWRGQEGRLEVWYCTLSDVAQDIGLWVHHELVAPTGGGGPARTHGWAALFRPGERPVAHRFGPESVDAGSIGDACPAGEGAHFDAGGAIGASADHQLRWDLEWGERAGGATGAGATAGTGKTGGTGKTATAATGKTAATAAAPLFTFPWWAWRDEVLPGCQILPVPSAPVRGVITAGRERLRLSAGARVGVARIYGHGNANRWGWLHADLGGGDLLEIVAAVSRQPGLDALPPMAFLQLRLGGRTWPADPMSLTPALTAELGLPDWHVSGGKGRRRIRVDVSIPAERAVAVDYRDPDGAPAVCTNSERADATVVLEHRTTRWEVAGRWELAACAHAEIGDRP